jgi:hypothetical protein
MVSHAYTKNFRTVAPFLLVEKLSLQEKKKKRKRKKVEPWKQWPLKFSGNTFKETNARANKQSGVWLCGL